MAHLSHEQIVAEVNSRGYDLVSDKGYNNMNSPITIRCHAKNHLIETSLANLRHPSFTCPMCDKDLQFINPKLVPQKTEGIYRLIALDQATENFGLSIFDDGKLVYYGLFNFTGVMINRLVKIKKFIEETVLGAGKPDFVEMEDIQYQSNGLITFKVLAMLLGIIQSACAEKDIPFEAVAPNVWRKYAGTCGKSRKEEKLLSVAVVKEKYGIMVTDDIAEAILIGRYGALMHKKDLKMFGN